MTRDEGQKFSDKHGANAQADPLATDKIKKKAKNGELACAVAFQIAKELKISPAEIGKAIDLLEFRISKCQLGLFGYGPEKKKVKPRVPENQQMEDAIPQTLVAGKLACHHAWSSAGRNKVPKMTVSAACEALEIKIKPCQLGAF